MIDMKLWEHECSMVKRGQTLRFNHGDCPAGQDTRRRLYLTRPASSAGIVVAYCHNCQDKGILTDDSDKFKDFDKRPLMNERVPFSQPSTLVHDLANWPTMATQWRMSKGLTKAQVKAAHIAYDPDTHRVYLPIYDRVDENGAPYTETELTGFQLRRLEGTGAKYLNAYVDNEVKPYTRFNPNDKLMCFLVEDMASGLRLADVYGPNVGVVVNYGIKCTPEVLYANSNIHRGIVWLDNDSEHVIDQAAMIARTWGLISGVQCYEEELVADPKNCTTTQINDILKDWSGDL